MAKNVLFGIIWLLLLIFIAWPIAWFCAGIWVFLQVSEELIWSGTLHVETNFSHTLLSLLSLLPQPFEAVFGFVKQINNFLEKLITWPRDCGQGKSAVSVLRSLFWRRGTFLIGLRFGIFSLFASLLQP